MAEIIAAFMLGCAVGMWVYRQGIVSVLQRNPTTLCDYCQFWMLSGKKPFPQKEKGEKAKRKKAMRIADKEPS